MVSITVQVFTGPAGQTYQVLTTEDLAVLPAGWTVLRSGTFGNTNVLFTDDAGHFARFYIIKSP